MTDYPTADKSVSPAYGDARSVEDGKTILRQAFGLYAREVGDLLRTAVDTADDLFVMSDYVSPAEAQAFLDQRPKWLERFAVVLEELFEKRLAGERRRGRRPDFDASLASLRVLTDFDQEKQAALTAATEFLLRYTRREIDAMDMRIAELLHERKRDVDNPFTPMYLLDAIGMTSRGVYSASKIWRALMERLVADITPSANKLYIHVNRFLADRGVLPDIKAALRARSDLWPEDDRDILPAFSRLMGEAGPLPTDIVVPAALGDPNAPPALRFVDQLPSQRIAPGVGPAGGVAIPPEAAEALKAAPQVMAGLAALTRSTAPWPAAPIGPGYVAPAAEPGVAYAHDGRAPTPGELPSLDPLMALGAASPVFAQLAQWQRLDLPKAIAAAAPPPSDGGTLRVPLNLVPYIRLAIADKLEHETDRISMDVVALLFDYIFRDGSIPDSLRELFGRLQVPVVKVGLLDRAFFSDRQHPARKLLDHLAAAAIGATSEIRYFEAFRSLADSIVNDICGTFEIDVAVFADADRRLTAFIESERRSTETAAQPDIVEANETEDREQDRSAVTRALRDRLAGTEVPFEVRSFLETVWVDHLTAIRQRDGAGGTALERGLSLVDDLLWSIAVKERTAQKARLTKMIPALVVGLRTGAKSAGADDARMKPFFDALYRLHMAAIKPEVAKAEAAAQPPAPAPRHGLPANTNVHDFVADMVLGTWLAFEENGERVNARLHWISPLRTRYVFTSRLRARAFVYTPEQLAWDLGRGRATLVLEPVPLFDRAVSSALDRIGALRPPQKAAA